MGGNDGFDGEVPIHSVDLGAFWIDRTEVTNAMFANFLNEKGNREQGGQTWLDAGDPNALIEQINDSWQSRISNYDQYPVGEVTWYGARAYCDWVGGRLPTTEEWDKAARGGLEGKRYPWGDEPPSCELGAENGANIEGCYGASIAIASFAPNGYGLYDMGGNVYEWVSRELDNGNYSLRGGGWFGTEQAMRLSSPSWRYPSTITISHGYFGFRCVRDVTPQE